MKLLGSVVVALALLLPAPARAQSIKAADLVGTWVNINPKDGDTLVFRPDSAFRAYHWGDYLRWQSLRGDTLFTRSGGAYTLTLKDQQITLTLLGLINGAYVAYDGSTYKRVDKPTPKP